jgi:large subunit ribosomal protein L7/L12
MKKEKIIEAIENMTVMELSDLVKELEEKFDVEANAPVAMAAAPQQGAAQQEEQTEFDVVLTEAGDQRLKVIKAVKDIGGFKLPEAKKFVDSAPKALKEGLPKEEAEELKKKLEDVGAKVELK